MYVKVGNLKTEKTPSIQVQKNLTIYQVITKQMLNFTKEKYYEQHSMVKYSKRKLFFFDKIFGRRCISSNLIIYTVILGSKEKHKYPKIMISGNYITDSLGYQ